MRRFGFIGFEPRAGAKLKRSPHGLSRPTRRSVRFRGWTVRFARRSAAGPCSPRTTDAASEAFEVRMMASSRGSQPHASIVGTGRRAYKRRLRMGCMREWNGAPVTPGYASSMRSRRRGLRLPIRARATRIEVGRLPPTRAARAPRGAPPPTPARIPEWPLRVAATS